MGLASTQRHQKRGGKTATRRGVSGPRPDPCHWRCMSLRGRQCSFASRCSLRLPPWHENRSHQQPRSAVAWQYHGGRFSAFSLMDGSAGGEKQAAVLLLQASFALPLVYIYIFFWLCHREIFESDVQIESFRVSGSSLGLGGAPPPPPALWRVLMDPSCLGGEMLSHAPRVGTPLVSTGEAGTPSHPASVRWLSRRSSKRCPGKGALRAEDPSGEAPEGAIHEANTHGGHTLSWPKGKWV